MPRPGPPRSRPARCQCEPPSIERQCSRAEFARRLAGRCQRLTHHTPSRKVGAIATTGPVVPVPKEAVEGELPNWTEESKKTLSYRRRTEGSNPSPSSGESH